MSEDQSRLVLKDIDISFGRLVMIFIKFGLAAIPAAIIVSLIVSVIMALIGSIFGGFGFFMHGLRV